MKVLVTKPSSGNIIVSDIKVYPWLDHTVELTLTIGDAEHLRELFDQGIREWKANNPLLQKR